MAKVQMQCPSCGGEVELGDIECRHCGTNLKSGESFAARVKQAKGKASHPELFSGRIYLGVTIAFVLVVFAGYMYQRGVEKTIRQVPELFEYPVLKMQEIRDIRAMGDSAGAAGKQKLADYHYGQARMRAEQLIAWIETEDRHIKLDSLYAPEKKRPSWMPPEREYDRRAAKRLLKTLKAKVQRLLDSIPKPTAA